MKKMLPLAAAGALFAPAGAHADPPFTSDDANTQGDGNWQYELNVERTSKQPDIGRQQLWNTTLTRGVGERVDLYVQAPYTHVQTRSDEDGSGFGDVEIGAKWRVLERGPLSIAVKPRFTMPTGNDARGLGNARANAGATLLAQYDVARFQLLANAGLMYQPNRQDSLASIWQASGAIIYRATDKLRLGVDIGISRNPERGAGANPAYVIAGAIYTPRGWLDVDVGYRRGLNDQIYDHALMAGITVRW
ncbi:transporter [Burkholderia thailandensis]|nr:transporter [Burkholderia thailandensis]AHI75626.1 metA-pathway of phenol degradation family protein [Burkholderia thailandensis 2002721723]AIP29254.1 metA-pathway of phenol degradation family protein [Burkholderia thailandensis E264]AJY02775.1 metA-pathway of phenol degradation family protein [Burkholderia thailandensis 2002721643]AVR06357.1 transporter [Burkholderia thailandensis]KIS54689.1 metA-pathway of phenol degradation family protein [Burkholderia thailandensis Phuket 4W-1]